MEQKLEDINGITRSRKSKKDTQIKKEKAKTSDPQKLETWNELRCSRKVKRSSRTSETCYVTIVRRW